MGIDGEITPHVMAKLSALSVRISRSTLYLVGDDVLLCRPPLFLESDSLSPVRIFHSPFFLLPGRP